LHTLSLSTTNGVKYKPVKKCKNTGNIALKHAICHRTLISMSSVHRFYFLRLAPLRKAGKPQARGVRVVTPDLGRSAVPRHELHQGHCLPQVRLCTEWQCCACAADCTTDNGQGACLQQTRADSLKTNGDYLRWGGNSAEDVAVLLMKPAPNSTSTYFVQEGR
jgi:hypothetical protein